MPSLPLICSWILDGPWLISHSVLPPHLVPSHGSPCVRARTNPPILCAAYDIIGSGHSPLASGDALYIIVYGIRGPTFLHRSVTGMDEIMKEAGDLHTLLPPLDAFPFLQYVSPTCDRFLRFIRILPDISRTSYGGGGSQWVEYHRVARSYTRVLLESHSMRCLCLKPGSPCRYGGCCSSSMQTGPESGVPRTTHLRICRKRHSGYPSGGENKSGEARFPAFHGSRDKYSRSIINYQSVLTSSVIRGLRYRKASARLLLSILTSLFLRLLPIF